MQIKSNPNYSYKAREGFPFGHGVYDNLEKRWVDDKTIEWDEKTGIMKTETEDGTLYCYCDDVSWYDSVVWQEYEAVKGYGQGICAAKRDGYWALLTTLNPHWNFTPFAFTECPKQVDGGAFVVNRFGKKGLYDVDNHSCVIPCDYEKIIFDRGENCYIVSKGAFSGKIGRGGNWIEHLHRD